MVGPAESCKEMAVLTLYFRFRFIFVTVNLSSYLLVRFN